MRTMSCLISPSLLFCFWWRLWYVFNFVSFSLSLKHTHTIPLQTHLQQVHSQLPKGYCMSSDTEHAIALTARWKRQIGYGRGHDISKFNLPSNLLKVLKGSGEALYPKSRNALSQMCRLQRSGPSALISALLRFVWILCAEYSDTTSDSSIGADVLFPSFLYCIVHADVPNLPLIVEFMETYSYFETPTVKIHAEKGAYYFETLKAALTWSMELEEPEARRSLAVD